MTDPIHPAIKRALRLPADLPDDIVMTDWLEEAREVCKPCWELKYCPYGPLVEQSPILPLTRADAEEHISGVRDRLESGEAPEVSRPWLEREVRDFDPEDYPAAIPEPIAELACSVFGHVCPVVFNGEAYTETSEERHFGRRHIPYSVKARVQRRDNSTCQICKQHLMDNEVEFDHVIPVAKGGSSDEHNVQVTCRSCNRKKSARVDHL